MGHYIPQDKFFKQAKNEGFRARSVFKLESIQERFHILEPGDKVLDLGAYPGSFLQYIAKVIGEKGIVIGIDLRKIEPLGRKNVKTYEGDINNPDLIKKIAAENDIIRFDVVTSDLAPATSGIKDLDAGRSFLLNEQALAIALRHLKPGGHFVFKAFPGIEHQKLLHTAKNHFKVIKAIKPPAVRKTSREQYVICLKKL
ncbi:RlmE family RNA methyltransferase [Candidatus Peregrinibacteria bacterium]|nr:RlmE family RNA methyltransferase [Candidatus Peregrinibacteria bacterium]